MKKMGTLIVSLLVVSAPVAQAVVIDRYAWQFPQVANIAGADDLIQDLQDEVQKILNAGHLAPIYIRYADIIDGQGAYRTYQEPGRTITTLAWAYPYLTTAQKTAVKTYVANELGNAAFAPWAANPLPAMTGTPRELHLKTQWWGDGPGNYQYRPRIQTIYGLWLYGYRTGDWTLIQNNWSSIKSFYTSRVGEANMYGTMGAHIAMARLADKFNDTAMRTTALNNLQTQLDAGLNFANIEANAIRAPAGTSPYSSMPDMYDSRMNSSTYRGWIFLNVTPEIGRYLASENTALTSAVVTRHNQGKTTFPYWWVNKANYFNRSMTGDEGSGLVPDMFGMYAPIERWVLQDSAPTLRGQMKSAPTGIGDCYWLEGLVQAIEATGALAWSDVRNPIIPPASACDVNSDNFTNVLDVQLCANQAIGAACTTGDINQDGACNVIDVQRVVNAALGGQCVTQ